MFTTDTAPAVAAQSSRARSVLVVIAGAVVAVAANSVIAASAIAAGASSDFAPLNFLVFTPFTVVGVVVAHLGWRIVRRRATRPAAVLRVLVPVLAVLSFLPDAVLAITGFIPNASLTAVIGLALMHVVVVAVVVPISLRLAPVH
jgi:hypothetical protein